MLTVGFGNSILFRELNEQLPSFDNTLVEDEKFINTVINGRYSLEFFTGDVLIIQVKVATGDTPNMDRLDCSGHISVISGALKTSYTDYDFWEFIDTIASGDLDKIFVYTAQNTPLVGSDDDWQSEPVTIISKLSTHYTGTNISSYTFLEWFNLDPTTGRSNNNFEMDYSTGITPFLRLPMLFKDYEPKSEISVYDNLDEATKLKERVQRTIELKSDAVPRWVAEKLVIVTAHDNLYINEVAFVREEKADINPLESNLSEFSAVLTQQNVLGLNTSDLGFNCDTVSACKITNLTESGVVVNTTFLIPEGFILHLITAVHNSLGVTNTLLKFGRTVGDDDIGTINVSPNAIGTYKDNYKTLIKHTDYAPTGDTTLYVDVSGATPNADITVQLIDKTP